MDSWPRNPINTFKPKNGLFNGTNIVKPNDNNDKSKYMYTGCVIAVLAMKC